MENNESPSIERKQIELLEQQLVEKSNEIDYMKKQLKSKEKLFKTSEKINDDLKEQIKLLNARLQSYSKIDELFKKRKVHSSSQTDLPNISQYHVHYGDRTNRTLSTPNKQQSTSSTKSLSPPLLSKTSLESLLADRRIILSGCRSKLTHSSDSFSSVSRGSILNEERAHNDDFSGRVDQKLDNSWHKESNNTQTRISDLVRNCVIQSMSLKEETDAHEDDYVYDERSRTYYSPSTQLYWYPDSSFFYDPKSLSYYHYDSARKSIQFHSTLKLNQTIEDTLECNVLQAQAHVISGPLRKSCHQQSGIITCKYVENTSTNSSTAVVENEEHLQITKIDNNESYVKKNKSLTPKIKTTSELEEGEISDSSSSDSLYDPSYKVERVKLLDSCGNVEHDGCPISDNLDYVDYMLKVPAKQMTALNYDDDPSCLRMIVMKSQTLDIGSLLLISPIGGIIGNRSKSHVCIPDVGISQEHCKVYYNRYERKYYLEDMSDDNSISLSNDGGLSFKENGSISNKFILEHATILRLGLETELLVHMHPGRDVTCDGCEPGIVQQRLKNELVESRIPKMVGHRTKEMDRRSNLKAMKRKYCIDESFKLNLRTNNLVSQADELSSTLPSTDLINSGRLVERKRQLYRDRAAERRATRIGSQNPYEKTDLTVGERPIEPKNKGYELLMKMGWSAGQRLGLDSTNESNLLEPIIVTAPMDGTTKSSFSI